ncbi:MAG: hypothetical protein HC898_05640, partial [Phycisphaerales bacterium]|nr:hypothetical protein [Phycisphaerales bacterium]
MKVQYPGQVHLMLANHDLAQVLGNEILKDGHGVVAAFNDGLDFLYGEQAPQVPRPSVNLYSVTTWRCVAATGCSARTVCLLLRSVHDLIPTVLDRVPTVDVDLAPGGSAY